MTIYSLVGKRIEDGGWSGVCRFDWMLRQIFPDLKSITPAQLPGRFNSGDVVIADNHLSLLVPDDIRTIVVHHGCAQTHFDRDADWRNDSAAAMVEQQRLMREKRNRRFVAPSRWVADEFAACYQDDFLHECYLIPHWVDRIERTPPPDPMPLIIGDWRDNNKGAGLRQHLADRCRQWEFRQLQFKNDIEKRWQYARASLYLCLSLSEGGSYAMADAEAARMPIVTTDTGNYREFKESGVIPWQMRDNLELVAAAIERRLSSLRGASFYDSYSFEDWARSWLEVVS
jgi:glycosyltransferase involved in cell wall biosynthesis